MHIESRHVSRVRVGNKVVTHLTLGENGEYVYESKHVEHINIDTDNLCRHIIFNDSTSVRKYNKQMILVEVED